MPSDVDGLRVTPLVVVDGGEDGTEVEVRRRGVYCCALPINMGHGVALKIGYELAVDSGAWYIVTLDADGQNDPQEMKALLEPLISGEADFVIGSRTLGVDHTTDRMRKAGVRFFGLVISKLIHNRLTDTSNGYRALKSQVLRDVTLEQTQYQTAELIISAGMHGWRIVDRPITWYPRASGITKKGTNLLFGVNYARVVLGTWRRERRRQGTRSIAPVNRVSHPRPERQFPPRGHGLRRRRPEGTV